MFVWQKRASAAWLAANEEDLNEVAGPELAIIQMPAQKSALAEVANKDRKCLEQLRSRFGGKIVAWPADWLDKFSRTSSAPPLLIGRRLRIVGQSQQTISAHELFVPAGAAFGTGQHPTTAMSLRLLEQVSRHWEPGWSLLDYGTGSGILALAAKKLGARRVAGIDLDPRSISTAKHNARVNRIRGAEFRTGDVRKLKERGGFNVVTANVFAGVLIEIAPEIGRRVKPGGFAILSGILRTQESDIAKRYSAAGLRLQIARRRGKWVALLAQKPI